MIYSPTHLPKEINIINSLWHLHATAGIRRKHGWYYTELLIMKWFLVVDDDWRGER